VQPVREFLSVKPSLVRQALFIDKLPKELVAFQSVFKRVNRSIFEQLLGPNLRLNHQNVCIELDYPDFNLEHLSGKKSVIILDHLQDEQNVGNIIRSAAAFDFEAVIVARNRAAKVSPVTDRIAAGGSAHIEIISVANIVSAIEYLKNNGFWIVSSSERADQYADSVLKNCDHPWGIVIGSEEAGVSHLVSERSDFHVKIRTSIHFSTLNAGNSAAILCYLASRTRAQEI
jgi:23S rRNA (guanosine2251-2'-O)-methyltransferase